VHVSRAFAATVLMVAVVLASVIPYADAADGRARVSAAKATAVSLVADDGSDQVQNQDATGGAPALVAFVVGSSRGARHDVTARLAHAIPGVHPPAPFQIRC
jgi:hypothetical protein